MYNYAGFQDSDIRLSLTTNSLLFTSCIVVLDNYICYNKIHYHSIIFLIVF